MDKTKNVTQENIDRLNWMLESHRPGSLISPETVKGHLGITSDNAHELLSGLLKDGLIELGFKVRCSCENKYLFVFSSINEFPQSLTCAECGQILDFKNDVNIVIRVV